LGTRFTLIAGYMVGLLHRPITTILFLMRQRALGFRQFLIRLMATVTTGLTLLARGLNNLLLM
jgi:hypothetical protein